MSYSKPEYNMRTGGPTALHAVSCRHGFTLIELMVALVILALAGTFIYTVFITQHNSYVTQKDVSETQEDVRVSLDMLTRDLQSTGYGVPNTGGVGVAGTGITAGTATSISFIAAQNFSVSAGASPYLTADAGGPTITVNNVSPFAVNGNIWIISATDRTSKGQFQINTINSAAKQLTLNATPSAYQGDLIVGTQDSIIYTTVADANAPGSFILQRTSSVSGTENLADHILNLQFSYTLKDGTVTTAPAASDLPNIRMVQVTITSDTVHDVDKAGTHARTRTLSAYVRVMNGLT